MSVIISEFEIVAEEPPAAAPARSADAAAEGVEGPPPPPRPMDVEDIVARQHQRQARLRAH